MEAKRLISANCGKEDPDELFQKANEELLKLVLAILYDEFFRNEAGEDIQIGDVTVESFDIDNKFLFACGDNEIERMDRAGLFGYVQRLLCKTLTKQASGEPFTDPLAAPSLGSTASYADTSGILSKRKALAEEDIGRRYKKPKN
jgi:hypothetical protein